VLFISPCFFVETKIRKEIGIKNYFNEENI
jgi:hypothetical protein